MTIPIKHFYMIRHGQTEANAAEIMAGSMDTPLTKLGIEQAERARDVIAQLAEKPVTIYHSHLSRARDTAQIINEALNVPMIEDPDWAEMHSGEWEGVSYETTRVLFRTWQTPPGGETPQDFWNRVKRAKIKALQQAQGPCLVVCHGGVMRAVGKLQNVEVPGHFKNAHLYEFKPSAQTQKFPWSVWDYDLCENTKTLIKNSSRVYDGAE